MDEFLFIGDYVINPKSIMYINIDNKYNTARIIFNMTNTGSEYTSTTEHSIHIVDKHEFNVLMEKINNSKNKKQEDLIKFEKIITDQNKKIDELQDQIKWMPGGTGYHMAKKEFESHASQ